MYPQQRLTALECGSAQIQVEDTRTEEEKKDDWDFGRRYEKAAHLLSLRVITRRQAFNWIFGKEEPKYFDAENMGM